MQVKAKGGYEGMEQKEFNKNYMYDWDRVAQWLERSVVNLSTRIRSSSEQSLVGLMII